MVGEEKSQQQKQQKQQQDKQQQQQRHGDQTTTGTVYICGQCNKIFITECHIAEHLKIHIPSSVKAAFAEAKIGRQAAASVAGGKNSTMVGGMQIEAAVCTIKVDLCSAPFASDAAVLSPNQVPEDAIASREVSQQSEHINLLWLCRLVGSYRRKQAFECRICGRHFRFQLAAADHVNQHTNRRPYKCRYCPVACRSSPARSMHENRNHADKLPPAQHRHNLRQRQKQRRRSAAAPPAAGASSRDCEEAASRASSSGGGRESEIDVDDDMYDEEDDEEASEVRGSGSGDGLQLRTAPEKLQAAGTAGDREATAAAQDRNALLARNLVTHRPQQHQQLRATAASLGPRFAVAGPWQPVGIAGPMPRPAAVGIPMGYHQQQQQQHHPGAPVAQQQAAGLVQYFPRPPYPHPQPPPPPQLYPGYYPYGYPSFGGGQLTPQLIGLRPRLPPQPAQRLGTVLQQQQQQQQRPPASGKS